MISEHRIAVERTAHYYQLGAGGPETEQIWIACHGYGQLARFFIRRFDVLDNGRHLVMAPEGLSLFYTEGLSEKPGASWMTREHRLDEIRDYTAYLDLLYERARTLCPQASGINLLGFSQGCATILRWVAAARPDFTRMLLWGGSLPDDVDYSDVRDYLNERELHLFYGDQDPFITPERLTAQQARIRHAGLEFQVHKFRGAHHISRKELERFT